jgi:hypothetical protein
MLPRRLMDLSIGFVVMFCGYQSTLAQTGFLPDEPIEIDTQPQFLVDDYLVDNRFAIKYKRQAVVRKFHAPVKHSGNPLFRGDAGYPAVVRDPDTGLFRMWYQISVSRKDDQGKHIGSEYAIAYADSKDGLHWNRPELGLYQWKGNAKNNVVWRGITDKRASGPCLLDLPQKDRHGFRYVMSYKTSAGRGQSGIRLVGSHDGIHWEKSGDTLIAELHSDTLNSIVYDPLRKRYNMYCRAKHIYRRFKGDIIDTGASRRVALMTNDSLWTRWASEPQNILIPDEPDSEKHFNFFYGMPVKYHAGIFWGFLWTFKMNDQIIPELAFSRDGVRFDRLPSRPRMIELGPEGSWDDGMVITGTGWVDVGDEWWIYYSGWDGPHGDATGRTPGMGLAKLKKERFVSLRGPRGGGVVITRKIKWPGGKLMLNADASHGELKVRISDAARKVLPGFDYENCLPVQNDSLSHEVNWTHQKIESLKGRVIRLEIYLKDADLFTFRATGQDDTATRQ